MLLEEVEALVLADDVLRPHKAFILGLAKPCVGIDITDESPMPHQSCFGGGPYAPPGFEWPGHPLGRYEFLGQINFSEIDRPPASLPRSGLLSLFFAFDEEGEIFWQDEGYVIAYFWDDLENFATTHSPHARPCVPRRITLTGGIDLPRHRDLRNDWPFDPAALEDIRQKLPEDYLLGYPSFRTLAYDPTPDGNWGSLITLDSHDRFGWCWHDADKLMVFIENAELARSNFGRLRSDAG